MSKNFDLKISFHCNNDCVHCVVADKREAGALSFEQVKSIIDGLKSDVTEIIITGGEPSINVHFLDIIRYCKCKKLKVFVQTNGTGFADLFFCKECAPFIDNILIAIHSCMPEIHDAIVQTKGMWIQTMKGFLNVLDCKIPISTQTVLSKINITTAYATYKMIQDIAPGTIMNITYPHLMGNAWNNRKDIIFKYSDYKDEFHRIFRDFGPFLATESIPFCYLYPYQDSVQECLEREIMNKDVERVGIDFYDGFSQKDYNELDISGRRKLPTCKKCIFDSKCPGVWREYIEFFADELDLTPITQI